MFGTVTVKKPYVHAEHRLVPRAGYLPAVYKRFHAGEDGLRSAVPKIYRAAGIRQGKGDRQGTHLFRYHVASALAGNGTVSFHAPDIFRLFTKDSTLAENPE